jgi:hypothetical protein
MQSGGHVSPCMQNISHCSEGTERACHGLVHADSYMQNLEVSNFPNAVGIKLAVNVSVMYNVWTEGTHG